MIRLSGKRKGPTPSIEIAGVTLRVRPALQALRDRATDTARAAASRLAEGAEDLTQYGLCAGVFEEFGDGEIQIGFGMHLYAVELAILIVEGWDGVVDDETDKPAEVSRRMLGLFMNEVIPGTGQTVASVFVQKAHLLSNFVVSEGNGSAAGPSDCSGLAAKPADPAMSSTSLA